MSKLVTPCSKSQGDVERYEINRYQMYVFKELILTSSTAKLRDIGKRVTKLIRQATEDPKGTANDLRNQVERGYTVRSFHELLSQLQEPERPAGIDKVTRRHGIQNEASGPPLRRDIWKDDELMEIFRNVRPLTDSQQNKIYSPADLQNLLLVNMSDAVYRMQSPFVKLTLEKSGYKEVIDNFLHHSASLELDNFLRRLETEEHWSPENGFNFSSFTRNDCIVWKPTEEITLNVPVVEMIVDLMVIELAYVNKKIPVCLLCSRRKVPKKHPDKGRRHVNSHLFARSLLRTQGSVRPRRLDFRLNKHRTSDTRDLLCVDCENKFSSKCENNFQSLFDFVQQHHNDCIEVNLCNGNWLQYAVAMTYFRTFVMTSFNESLWYDQHLQRQDDILLFFYRLKRFLMMDPFNPPEDYKHHAPAIFQMLLPDEPYAVPGHFIPNLKLFGHKETIIEILPSVGVVAYLQFEHFAWMAQAINTGTIKKLYDLTMKRVSITPLFKKANEMFPMDPLPVVMPGHVAKMILPCSRNRRALKYFNHPYDCIDQDTFLDEKWKLMVDKGDSAESIFDEFISEDFMTKYKKWDKQWYFKTQHEPAGPGCGRFAYPPSYDVCDHIVYEEDRGRIQKLVVYPPKRNQSASVDKRQYVETKPIKKEQRGPQEGKGQAESKRFLKCKRAILQSMAISWKEIKSRPHFSKGYFDLGKVCISHNYPFHARRAFRAGLMVDPDNPSLKSELERTETCIRELEPTLTIHAAELHTKPFESPEMWSKLATNPETAEYLKQADYSKKLEQLKRTGTLRKFLDEDAGRFEKTVDVLLGIPLFSTHLTANDDDLEGEPSGETSEWFREWRPIVELLHILADKELKKGNSDESLRFAQEAEKIAQSFDSRLYDMAKIQEVLGDAYCGKKKWRHAIRSYYKSLHSRHQQRVLEKKEKALLQLKS